MHIFIYYDSLRMDVAEKVMPREKENGRRKEKKKRGKKDKCEKRRRNGEEGLIIIFCTLSILLF